MGEQKSLVVDVSLNEDESTTAATARVTIGAKDHAGTGIAKRNPDDPNVPAIGEELATARALSDLSHKLVEAAATTLEDALGKPVSLSE